MQKVNLGYLSWNPLNWFKEKPAETAVIRTAAGGTMTVPVKTVVPPGYIPSDITAPEHRAATEYVPGRGYAPAGATTGSTGGNWFDSFMTSAKNVFSMWANYQATASQSEKDRLAMQIQHDLEMARLEAALAPPTITIPGFREPIAVDWQNILKATLLVGGIGLGIVLITKK